MNEGSSTCLMTTLPSVKAAIGYFLPEVARDSLFSFAPWHFVAEPVCWCSFCNKHTPVSTRSKRQRLE